MCVSDCNTCYILYSYHLFSDLEVLTDDDLADLNGGGQILDVSNQTD